MGPRAHRMGRTGDGLGALPEMGRLVQKRAMETGQNARKRGRELREQVSKEATIRRKDLGRNLEHLGSRLEKRSKRLRKDGRIPVRAAGRALYGLGDLVEASGRYVRKHDVRMAVEDLRDQIRAHPFVSTGVALGVGVLVGRALAPKASSPVSETVEENETSEKPRGRNRLLLALAWLAAAAVQNRVEHRLRS